jgi:hypothetical protein
MHFRFPVLAAAQLVNVAPRGQEPPLLEAQEDVRLFCPQLAASDGAPAPAAARRRLFDAPGGLAGVTMSPDHVWTIHLHQSLIDFSTYKLGLAGVPFGIDLVSLLDRQPLQIMAKDGGVGGGPLGSLLTGGGSFQSLPAVEWRSRGAAVALAEL